MIRIAFIAIVFLETIFAARANVFVKPVKYKDNKSIAITLNQAANLNYLSKADILSKREKYLRPWHSLLEDTYKPDSYVFESIEDGKPWWGMQGSFIWGAGQHSIDGPAEESRFIFNPLLLVGANSYTALIWQKGKISVSDLADASFPLCWLPDSLTYFPSLSLAQVSYPVSKFNKQIQSKENRLRFNTARLNLNSFGLIAYNARDFGFQYLYLDMSNSMNVVNVNGYSDIVLIKQMLHCGNSSKFPGGCNNMSPAMPEIDHFAITALPARACVYLWKNKPISAKEKANFTFYLDFR